jgi:HEAT repeat protein
MMRVLSVLCVAFVLSIGSGSTVQAADPARMAIAGLDSLVSGSLHLALEYLEIQPRELGFDKLYAEDDTFRLALVERFLDDPLEIPGWQTTSIQRIREVVDRPVALAGLLGEICEAPDAGRDRDRRRSSDEQAGEDGLGWTCFAERYGWEGASLHPGLPETAGDAGAGSLDAFIRGCREAEESLRRAFADLSSDEKNRLLIVAPAFWGDHEDDPLDRARKGGLHFEIGAEADTTLEISEDAILDAAVKVDRSALTRAARLFLGALRAYVPEISIAHPGGEGPGPTGDCSGGERLPGVTGAVSGVFETPWGLLVIGGAGPNVYSSKALERIAFLIEPGGDDVYRGRAASAVGELIRPLAAVVDLAGDDFYDAGERAYVLGGAVLGVAALIDLQGNDVYRGGDGSLGSGFFGAGFLYDGQGVDFFEGRNFCQGAGAFGIGALVSGAAQSTLAGPELQEDRAYDEGLVKVPGTGAVPIRYDENDTYRCARMSQGFAATFGVGLLYDRAGNDVYHAGGHYLHAPLLPHDFQSLSQGYSIGFRPRAAGGVGILVDETGNDFYDAEVYAQGVGYWYSIGLLFDGAGNDRYHATQYAQGAGVHLAVGSLWDVGGDDHYVSRFGVTQGTSHDLSVGWLLDEGGNDYYVVSDGQGISITNSVSIFIDSQGDDFYATPRGGQGKVTWARGFCGAGIFLDLEGKDTYSRDAAASDGAIWSQDFNSLGIDLDRDLKISGGTVPTVVLTAEDSLRSVEELFETASLWEVGSARGKVRRARAALKAKGLEAVDYVVAEKLETRGGLEYRAIEELAKAYPDSFAARIMPRLADDDEQVRRNVIGLLGDLKCREACAPLTDMLRKKTHERDWIRIIRALGRIGDPEVSSVLRPFLRDEQERRRIYAVAALASLKDTAAVETLTRLLADPLLTVRAAAFSALRSLGAPAVVPIVDRLENDPPQRSALVRTLGRVAVSLRDSVDVPSVQARAVARRTLMAELDRSIDARDAPTRAATVAALVGLGGPETLDFVRLRMQDESDPLVLRTFEIARTEGRPGADRGGR